MKYLRRLLPGGRPRLSHREKNHPRSSNLLTMNVNERRFLMCEFLRLSYMVSKCLNHSHKKASRPITRRLVQYLGIITIRCINRIQRIH
jgi:hypothetical protein